jgi:hypothetical protein
VDPANPNRFDDQLTMACFEVMRMFKNGQFAPWIDAIYGGTEARFINRLFGLYA